jgi:SP family general alpha glucoside:H+ symporter-like MFS transporter
MYSALIKRRRNIGAIIVSVMMQQLNEKHPDNYLLAMRILWAPIGFMLLCWAFIPESPWFHARRGNKDAAMKSLKQLFGGVEGYDCEEEYGIITRTIEHENEMLSNQPSYRDVFKGLNLVSSPRSRTKAHRTQRRTLTVMILAVCQQLAGLSIISTYSTCTSRQQRTVTNGQTSSRSPACPTPSWAP